MAVSYLDFDLLIERSGQRYRAPVLNSPAGQATHEFRLPFNEQELQVFVLQLGLGARRNVPVLAFHSPEMTSVKSFGRKLFNAVFDGDVHSCLQRSQDQARQLDSGVRIRLRLAEAKPGKVPLTSVPWEFLYDEDANDFLCASDHSPLVRYPNLPQLIQPLRVKPPLRILAMISRPDNFSTLGAAGDWSNLEESVQNLVDEGEVVLERLSSASLGALQRRLRRREEPVHIFHFIGHGGFDERGQDGVLVLEDEEGHGRLVSGEFVGQVLHNHSSLRLAVLNACEGARTSATDPFAGVAQTLVQRGIPAVIAMQFEITDQAAVAFSQEFYMSLADGMPVDVAVAQGRTAVMTRVNVVEWATPVLYLRSQDGQIFDLKEPPGGLHLAKVPGTLSPEIDHVSAMKFYNYISDTKVDMLFSQIPTHIGETIAAELNIDLEQVQVNLSSDVPDQTRYLKLGIVVRYIEKHLGVGTVDEPSAYLRGNLPMRWGPYGPAMVYFGAETRHTILGMAGSAKHVIGSIGDAQIEHLPISYMPHQILSTLEKAILVEEPRLEGGSVSLQIVEAATTGMTGPQENLEFLARRLVTGELATAEGAKNTVLATPIYVALAD